MNFPAHLRYTEDHEWVQVEGDLAVVGITDYAQSELGDIVFIELPESGIEVQHGTGFGTIEAVKTVSDLYAPISGTIVEVNTAIADEPETVNSSPYEDGWMVKIKPNDMSELESLMEAEQYQEHVGEDH
ncbi:MAG: glycine cleavage system protein GcvH [Candidatus Eisenbacteria bacterium]|uniref:Glycine cleavage system H protein n=1 Tax=Eiseniibacteriota bacterium TaxID=2212470 RepID=A0A7Y2EAB6_UNCEI|nr:glycine cleavage system protein GcvH [Candidatus Eisenbacteria bacterium]